MKSAAAEWKEHSEIHSFVVRIWIENGREGAHPLIWHGIITDVFSGEKSSINELSQITEFINQRLNRIGESKPATP